MIMYNKSIYPICSRSSEASASEILEHHVERLFFLKEEYDVLKLFDMHQVKAKTFIVCNIDVSTLEATSCQ